MRHADIKTTLDFYADVEQADIEALWPEQHNKSHNRQPEAEPVESPDVQELPWNQRRGRETPCPLS